MTRAPTTRKPSHPPSTATVDPPRDTILAAMAGLGVTATYLGVRHTTSECQSWVDAHRDAPGPLAAAARALGDAYCRARASVDETIATYSDPVSDKLLPPLDVLYPPHIVPLVRTLALDLEDTIVHSEYRRDRGWLTFKRPGVEELLKAAYNLGYEVVLYTDADHMTADPVMERLDPGRQYVPFRLFRDSTQFTGTLLTPGVHARDLSKLNRDPARTLYLTHDAPTAQLQPDNLVRVGKWEGDPDDTQLLDLIPVLQMIVQGGVRDVRDVARAYRGTVLPVAFKERAAKAAAAGGKGGGWLGKGKR